MLVEEHDLSLKHRYRWDYTLINHSDAYFFGNYMVFNRHDGYQVLRLINKLDGHLKFSGNGSTERIEQMLIFLPEEKLSVAQVKQWIILNWNKPLCLK